MSAGVSTFNRAASSAYKSITSTEKEALSQRCVVHTHTMSAKAIKREGMKIFLRIQKLVKQVYLHALYYCAIECAFVILL